MDEYLISLPVLKQNGLESEGSRVCLTLEDTTAYRRNRGKKHQEEQSPC